LLNTALTMIVIFTGLEPRVLHRVLEHSCCHVPRDEGFLFAEAAVIRVTLCNKLVQHNSTIFLGNPALVQQQEIFRLLWNKNVYCRLFHYSVSPESHIDPFHIFPLFPLRYTLIILPPIPSSSSSLLFPYAVLPKFYVHFLSLLNVMPDPPIPDICELILFKSGCMKCR